MIHFRFGGLLLAQPWLWHFIQQLELPLARSENFIFTLHSSYWYSNRIYNREIMDNDTEKGIKCELNAFLSQ